MNRCSIGVLGAIAAAMAVPGDVAAASVSVAEQTRAEVVADWIARDREFGTSKSKAIKGQPTGRLGTRR
ncbi:MAG TPA: hypothetical protein VE890_17510 [Thermoguttaceae bacterium]|nr:hypothetical protein [Thermoguttaceae bacterium]